MKYIKCLILSLLICLSASAQSIRVDAGAWKPHTNSLGQVWVKDSGFGGGSGMYRGKISIAGTTDPIIYRTEHYSMTNWIGHLPNGSYTAHLYFAETFEGITNSGMRVFSVNVNGRTLSHLDIYALAGGRNIAHVETVPVTVTNGEVNIQFVKETENPEINGIEITK
jgi:hypothetical protein